MALVRNCGAYDRAAIMKESHRLYRRALGGIGYGDALRVAWSRARAAGADRLAEIEAFGRLRWAA